MVGIVIVSHSKKIAEGIVELAALMAPETPMRAAGGMEDGGFGTSYDRIYQAIDEVYSDDGVIVLMDLGSSVMTTKSVIEDMVDEDDRLVKMVDCPVVEGAVVAAVAAAGEASMDEVIEMALTSASSPKF